MIFSSSFFEMFVLFCLSLKQQKGWTNRKYFILNDLRQNAQRFTEFTDKN